MKAMTMAGVCAVMLGALGCDRHPHAAFAPTRVTRSYRQTLKAPPERVLPLLTPVREAEWAEGWAPTILSAAPTPESPGTVFRTSHPGEPDTLWLLEEYDPAQRRVRYVHVTPGSDVCEIQISLEPAAEGRTYATVQYTYTTLGAPGEARVRHFTEEHYARWMEEWEDALNHYLVTGQRPHQSG